MTAATLLAFAASLCVTPLVARLARRFHILDSPDGHRKLHTRAIPLGGGCAVLLAFALVTMGMLLLSHWWGRSLVGEIEFVVGLLLFAAAVCGLGLIDDKFILRGRQKLVGQMAAVGLIMSFGLVVERIAVFGWTIELGLLSIPFTAFWLMGAVNAFNLLDGLDGLAASMGMVLSVALAATAYQAGHHGDAMLAMILAGSLAGFLVYNFPPATIFLGDAGSLLIGLLVGALAIRCSLTGPATMALAAPLALMAIPIFDVSMAVLRRKLAGLSVYTSDCSHLHHMLRRQGFSDRRIVLLVVGLCCVCGVGAFASVRYHNDMLALGGALGVLGLLVAARWFGHAELRLLIQRIREFLWSFVQAPAPNSDETNSVISRLQDSHQWQCLWTMLVDYAERFDLNAVHLHIRLPTEHEVYGAFWHADRVRHTSADWSATVPLIAHEQVVGHLEICGMHVDGRETSSRMAELIDGLKPFEVELIEQLETFLTTRDDEFARDAGQLVTIRDNAARE